MKKHHLIFIIFLYTLSLLSTLAKAQNNPTPQNEVAKKTAKDLEFLLPQDFKGILYNCEPLCVFLSLKEDKTWNPPLDKIVITLQNPRWVFNSDPIYPLLIEQSPIKPFVKNKAGNKKDTDEVQEIIPTPPPAPFSFGYTVHLSQRQLTSHIQSNSTPQEGMDPTGAMQAQSVTLGLMKGDPFYMLKQWIQPQLFYIINMPGKTKNLSLANFSQGGNEIIINFFSMKKDFKFGMRYVMQKTDFITTANILSNYTFSENWSMIGVGFFWKRFQFYIDNGLSVKINEQQAFREKIENAQLLRMTLDWCSSTKEIFDFGYGFCFGANTMTSENTAVFPDAFNSTQQSKIKRTEQEFKLSLRLGDDFFK